MASGIIPLNSTRDVLEGRIVWNSTSNGSSANTSNVYADIQVRRNDGYETKGTWTGTLNINEDKREFSNSSTTVGSTWVTMKSFTITKAHNSDGTGTCWISGWVNGPSGTSMEGYGVEGGQTVTLDKIPRYLTITSFKVQSKTINTAVISWSVSDPRSSTHYSLNGGTWIGSATDGESLASDQKSGTFNIKNLSPNTTYKLKIKCTRSDSGLETVSSEISFTTYDYAKLSSVPNVNIGSAHTITWTNPAGATTSLKLCKTDNSSIIDYGTVTGTSKSLTPTAATIYALTPNSNTYKARYILTTTQNSKTYTNYKDFTFTVTNSNPTFTNYTYQDTNATTVALTGNNQILVKGYSNLKATVSTDNKAIAKNSATMKSYKLVIGSKSTSANYSSTADVSLSVNNVDSGTIVLYATDSRGNSTAVTKTATYKEYTDLVIKSVTAERGSNGVGQDVTLKFNGTYWNDSFGNVTNTITNAKYYYRETSASDWIEGETELTFTTENGQFSGDVSIKGDLGANGFDVSKSFNIRLQVTDKLVTKTYDITLGSGTPAIAIYKDRVAIGGKYDTDNDCKLQIYGNACMSKSSEDTFYRAKRADTGTEVDLGIDDGGINHGVWSKVLDRWLLYADALNTYMNGSSLYVNNNLTNPTGIKNYYPTFVVSAATGPNYAIRTNDGFVYRTLEGTASAQGYGILVLGNGVATGNAGNKIGMVRIYGTGTGYSSISFPSITSNGYSVNLPEESGTIQLKPTTLYDNSSGTAGTITLSESVANFSYIEIFFKNTSDSYESVKVYSPSGKIVTLTSSLYEGSIYLFTKRITLSGTSITNKDYCFMWANNGGTVNIVSENKFIIVKVIGYR